MTTATTSPDPQRVLEVVPKNYRWRAGPGAKPSRKGLYAAAYLHPERVVIWLMTLQRLLPKFTLAHAVQHFALWRDQLGDSVKPISLRASAYCRARMKLPTIVASQVFDLIADRLSGWLPKQQVIPNRAVFVLDGTTLSLPHSAEPKKAYPPAKNQHAVAHWPMIRLVVAQDVQTGLALRPEWGPYRGPESVSEQD